MKAIILGSLGALIDMAPLRRSAFRGAFAEHGLSFDKPPGTYLQALIGHQNRERSDARIPVGSILAARDAQLGEALARGPLKRQEGLDGLLARAAAGGVPLALVLGSPTSWLVSALDGLSLMPELFDAIVTSEHVAASKPAPDGYHLAAALLATAPEHCIAVEDTRSGLQAARAAGMGTHDLRKEPLSQLIAGMDATTGLT